MSKFAMTVAGLLCALVFWATLDKIPDDPAVLKQLKAGHALVNTGYLVGNAAPAMVAVAEPSAPGPNLEILLPSFLPRRLCLAADSSPPLRS